MTVDAQILGVDGLHLSVSLTVQRIDNNPTIVVSNERVLSNGGSELPESQALRFYETIWNGFLTGDTSYNTRIGKLILLAEELDQESNPDFIYHHASWQDPEAKLEGYRRAADAGHPSAGFHYAWTLMNRIRLHDLPHHKDISRYDIDDLATVSLYMARSWFNGYWQSIEAGPWLERHGLPFEAAVELIAAHGQAVSTDVLTDDLRTGPPSEFLVSQALNAYFNRRECSNFAAALGGLAAGDTRPLALLHAGVDIRSVGTWCRVSAFGGVNLDVRIGRVTDLTCERRSADRYDCRYVYRLDCRAGGGLSTPTHEAIACAVWRAAGAYGTTGLRRATGGIGWVAEWVEREG